jgi:NAD-reducing hydrogenase small subunit
MNPGSVSDPVPPRLPRLATVWLAGCSGCHMSFLDQDERLFDLAALADLVYSPFMDAKEFPEGVDVTLVEGAVATEDNIPMLRLVRERSRVVVAFGDCAVIGNVTALRNPAGGAEAVLRRSYLDPTNLNPGLPRDLPVLPPLLDKVVPIHHVVHVDHFLPGCPPSGDLIHFVVTELLAGRVPDLTGKYHFG